MRHKVLIICRRQIQENTATLAMSRINAFSRRDVNRILLVHSWQAWQPSPHRLLRNNNMTRGNQRDLARARNAKKQGNDKGKKADDGMSAAARKLRDAEIMQQKQKKANDPKAADEKAK